MTTHINFLLVGLFFSLLVGCGPDEMEPPINDDAKEEEQVPIDSTMLITLEINGQLVKNDDLAVVIATNGDGDVIGYDTLVNDATNVIKGDIDLASETYSIHVLTRTEQEGKTNATIETFMDVRPYTIRMNAWQGWRTIELFLEHEGKGIAGGSYGHNGFVQNSTHFQFSMSTYRPGDDSFVTFQFNDEDYARYFWVQDVEGYGGDTLTLEDTKVIEDPTSIRLPEEDIALVSIEGMVDSRPARPHNIWWTSDSDTSEHQVYVPMDHFDSYLIQHTARRPGQELYSSVVVEAIPQSYQIEPLAFDLLTTEIDGAQVRMTTSGVLDYFRNTHTSVTNLSDVLWHINGVASENCGYTIPDLSGVVTELLPNADYDGLSLQRTEIWRTPTLTEPMQFMAYQLNPSSWIEEAETIQYIREEQ